MPSWLWTLLIVVLLIAVMLALAGRAAVRGVDPTQVSLSPEVADQARALARQGQKIPAIRLIRDHTRMPLAAAKMIVDRMAAGDQRG